MSTIRRIALADFEDLLDQWQPRRQITEFHLHCTDRPRHADFRGQATIEAMRTYHMRKGWSDIAQHLTVDPGGGLWTGRSWDRPPASASGHNGDAKRGPFMIEMIGNFDPGLDKFEGPQKDAVLGVIAAVLKKAGLGVEALRFHNEFTRRKTCPGRTLDLEQMRQDVDAVMQGQAVLPLPAASDAVLGRAEIRGWFKPGARGEGDDALLDDDPFFAEVPEGEWMLAEQEALAARLDSGQESARRAPLPADAPLRRHAINLSKGVLSRSGDIDSEMVNPRTIVDKHLVDYLKGCKAQKRPANVVFYAHGGLVNEASAVCYARTVLPWWLRNGVFPIFFIWESGLLETLRQTPRGARGFTDLTDWLLEGLTQPAARRVWAEMKDDAGNASRQSLPQYEGRPGGAWQLAQLLLPVLAAHPETRLHAVGHSTGPILLSKFLPLLTSQGYRIRTLSYLAPAIRTDRFLADVAPMLNKGIDELCMYTMTDQAERADTCAGIYRKSLLYFVREACEDRDEGRILGLEKDLYGNARLRKLFGLPDKYDSRIRSHAGTVKVEFSPAPGSTLMNDNTRSLQHGGFDNDADTMVSVLARILGIARTVTRDMQFPSAHAFKACGFSDATRAAPVEPQDEQYGGCPCCGRRPPGTSGGTGLTADGRDGFGDDAESGGGSIDDDGNAAPPSPPRRDEDDGGSGSGGGSGGGRRIAVCIGIDDYPDQPLAGCVADSQLWAQALSQSGFQVQVLHNAQATRAAMHEALSRLVGQAGPGDELVFQYSGHGAQLPDVGRDEGDDFDEVFVPFDYHQGQMLIDDDIREITRTLREDATLTLFMDCCHSGTISRARAPALPRGAAASGLRPRLMSFDRQTVSRYLAARGVVETGDRRGTTRADAGASGSRPKDASPGPNVAHFAACLDHEYAWESNGQGDFTRAALAVLATALSQDWSNDQFIAAVIRQLGSPLRQHPGLSDPAPGIASRRLLGRR